MRRRYRDSSETPGDSAETLSETGIARPAAQSPTRVTGIELSALRGAGPPASNTREVVLAELEDESAKRFRFEAQVLPAGLLHRVLLMGWLRRPRMHASRQCGPIGGCRKAFPGRCTCTCTCARTGDE